MEFDYKYLSEEQLAGFEKYKYCAVDTNPLSIYLMHPFWNRVVELCPMWLAPNLLTFAGFLLTVGATALLSFFDWHFFASSGQTPPVPAWVFAAVSVLIFVAYTLDGIDGKQARRTGSSGPLGELFDHGLDSWTAVLIPVCLYSVFGRSEHSVTPLRFYGICWNVFLTFYTTHWEKYITGILFLPWGYDLSMLSTTGVFAATYWIGHDGWKQTLLGTLSTGRVLEIVFYLSSLIATLPVSVINVLRAHRQERGKHSGWREGARPLAPLSGLLAVSVTWALVSPTDIVSAHPRAFMLMTGTVFSNITCRLVVSQMSGSRCAAWNALISAEALAFATALLFPALETVVLYMLWLFATCAHIHYGTCVVRQMCGHFRIRCFSVGKLQD